MNIKKGIRAFFVLLHPAKFTMYLYFVNDTIAFANSNKSIKFFKLVPFHNFVTKMQNEIYGKAAP